MGRPVVVPKFFDRLCTEKISERPKKFRLTSALHYQSRVIGAIIVVPEGFVTDMASVPRLPLAYMVAGGVADESAVIHDYLYQTHQTGFMVANLVFLEAMKTQRIEMWRRHIMFHQVCLFGGSSYKSGPSRFKIIPDGKK